MTTKTTGYMNNLIFYSIIIGLFLILSFKAQGPLLYLSIFTVVYSLLELFINYVRLHTELKALYESEQYAIGLSKIINNFIKETVDFANDKQKEE